MRAFFIGMVLVACVIPAQGQFVPQPYVDHVQDAASYTSGIAPGGLFVVKGYSICPAGLKISPLPLQEKFNGLTVSLKPVAGGDAVNAFMLYTYSKFGNDDQIAAVLPSSVTPGVYDVIVNSGTTTVTGSALARVVPRKYRSLANNQQGYGLAVIQNYVDATHVDRNMFVAGKIGGLSKAPAKPGQTVILWGLGLGAISKPDNEAPGALDLRSSRDVRVAVGGADAPVIYAGRAPEFPGIDQINFTLPADVATGCNVPLEVIVDRSASNPVTMAIAPSDKDACEHPFLTREQLEKLDQGGKFLAGDFNMMVYREPATSMSGQPFVEINSALGYFGEMNASRASTVNLDSVPTGRCTSWRSGGKVVPGMWLDAYAEDSYDGGKLALTGPDFADAPLDDDDDWYYGFFSMRRISDGQLLSGNAQYVYKPGEYTLRGSGGSRVDAFEARLQVPEFLTWVNMDSIQSIDRNSSLEIRWTGGGANDLIIVEGVSAVMVGGSVSDPEVDAGSFMCALPPTSQSFILPASVLKLLPASGSGTSAGVLIVAAFAHGSRATFKAAVKASATDPELGTELGMATFGHLVMTMKLVGYQ